MERKTKRSLALGSLLLLFLTNLCVLIGYAGAKDMPSYEKNTHTRSTGRFAPGNFVTEWDLSKSGSPITGETTKINFGLNISGDVGYTWTSTTGESGSGTIRPSDVSASDFGIAGLPKDGKITLELQPQNLQKFFTNNKTDRQRLVNVAQWGTAKWITTSMMFSGCTNLDIDATDMPDISGVSTMQDMFRSCSLLTGPSNIGAWDVGKVEIFVGMFQNALLFNRDISGWNLSKAIELTEMFKGASAFNQNLGAWNLNKVTNLIGMFDKSGLSCINYSETLIGWAANPNTASGSAGQDIYFGADGIKYGTNAKAAHDELVNKGWNFYNDVAGDGACVLTRDFITKWDLSLREKNENVPSVNFIKFQIVSDGPVDYIVKDENGTTLKQDVIPSLDGEQVTIDNLPANGKFTLSLNPIHLKRFFFIGPSPATEKTPARLAEVQQWGDVKWASMLNAFMRCENLEVTATDKPDLAAVTNMQYMFYGCSKLTGPDNINEWDISNVTTLRGTFQGASVFNQPLDNWNTSNVNSLQLTFYDAHKFNQPIGSWETKAVTTMLSTFYGATEFNQPIGGWNTSRVSTFQNMFRNAKAFNQNIGDWDVANVGNMSFAFEGASVFNQDLGRWNTGRVTQLQNMFQNATAFNQDIGAWNTGGATQMQSMFDGATAFNQDIRRWNTEKVNNMSSMFKGASSFNWNLGIWNLQGVTDVKNMLDNSGLDCINMSKTLIGWASKSRTPSGLTLGAAGRSYGTNAEGAYNRLTSAKSWTISGASTTGAPCIVADEFVTVWDQTKGTAADKDIKFNLESSGPVFYTWTSADGLDFGADTVAAGTAAVQLENLPVDKVIELRIEPLGMQHFYLDTDGANPLLVDVKHWSTVAWTSMEKAFYNAENLNITATDIPDLTNVGSMREMFFGAKTFTGVGNIDSWNTAAVTDMSGMFSRAASFNADISGWDTENVVLMESMFSHTNLFNQDISGWNTAKVTSMKEMFASAPKFNQPIGSWSTGDVEDMEGMFDGATDFNQNLSNWTTGKVTDMARMFRNVASFNQDISGWTTSAVKNMSGMFMGASTFNQPIGVWNTVAVTNMSSMFENATVFNQPLGAWNTTVVTDMSRMFSGATAFNHNIGSFRLDAATDLTGMLDNSGLDCINYSKTLITWSLRPSTPSGLTFGAVGRSFGTYAQKAFDLLKNTKNWAITDDGAGGASCLNQSDFVTEWDLSLTGTPAENGVVSIEFMMNASADVKYSWTTEDGDIGEGTIVAAGNNIATISDLPEGKKIVLSLEPTNLRRFYFDVDQGGPGGRKDRERLVDVKQWGTTKWTSMSDAFESCSSLEAITATDIPDLALVDNMHDMFKDCKNLVSVTNMRQWNTSFVKDMSNTFSGAEKFNEDISSWNTSAVENMMNMFNAAKAFNQNISNWETGLVTTMRQMFYKAEAFNQNISNWNTVKVENMSGMFWEALAFNGTIGDWNTGAVTDMGNMFYNAPVFNQDLRWNTANVTDMHQMFNGAKAFNGRLDVANGNWNTGRVITMQDMFRRTDNFNQPIGGWDVGNVTKMYGMFWDAKAFDQPIGDWDTKNVTTMEAMFKNATSFNKNLQWNTVKVNAMRDMFSGATAFNGIFGSDWNTAAVTDMTGVFTNAKAFTSDLNWNTSNVTTMYAMFDGAESFNGTFGPDWNTSNVTTMSRMFRSAKAFNQDVSGWNTAKVTTMSEMFWSAAAFNQNLADWDLSSIGTLGTMLNGSGMDCFNYSSTLIGWAANPLTPNNITFGVINLTYGTNAQEAHDILTGTKEWKMTGDKAGDGYCGVQLAQTINPIADIVKTYGDADFDPGATATSDLEVVYVSADNSIAEYDATTKQIKIKKIGEVVITAQQPGDDMYLPADDVTFKLTVNKAVLTVTVDAKSKEFGDIDPPLTYVLTDVNSAVVDSVGVITGELKREEGADVGVYKILQNTLTAGDNYNITYVEADFTITKKSIYVLPDEQEKVYGDADPELTYSTIDETGNAVVMPDVTFTGELSRDPGEDVGSYEITIGDLTAGDNYEIVLIEEKMLTVKPAPLEVSAVPKSKVFGAADPALAFTVKAIDLKNGDTDAVVTGALSREPGDDVGTYKILQGTLTAGANYDLTYVGADFTITKKSIYVLPDDQEKVYGDADPELTYSTIDETGNAVVMPDVTFTGELSRDPGEDVGSYEITIGDLTAGDNYEIVLIEEKMLTIKPAPLEVSAVPKSKVFGEADPALTFTVKAIDLKNGDTDAVVTGSLIRELGEDAGTYKILQGTLAAGANYDLMYVGADFTITKKSIYVLPDEQEKVYGDADPELTYSTIDETGNAVVMPDVTFTGELSRDPGEDVGSYEITIGDLTAGDNYEIVLIEEKMLTIKPAPLEVSAVPKSKVFGAADPALTFTVKAIDLKNGDTDAVVTGSLIRELGEDAGTYKILQGTLTAGANYYLTYVGADFTITKKSIYVLPDEQEKVYGDADPELTYSTIDETGNAVVMPDVTFTGELSRDPGEDVGSYEITIGDLTAGDNYEIVLIEEKMLTIKPAPLEVSAVPKSKVFGAADPALTFTVKAIDLKNGDTDAVVTGSLIRELGEDAGTYKILQGTLTAGANYDLTYVGADFTITKKSIYVLPDEQEKVYGDADPELTYSTIDETGNAVVMPDVTFTGELSRDPGEDVGSYEITIGDLTAGDNYEIVLIEEKMLTIKPAPLEVSAVPKSKVFGAADPALTFTVKAIDLKNGDTDAVVTGSLIRELGEDAGTYKILQGTLTAGANYDLTYVGADFTITAAAITITPEAKSKVYGTSDPALTYITEDASGTAVDLSAVMTGQLSRVIGEDVGSYEIGQGSLSAGPNYTITFTTGKKLTITAAAITITPEAKSKVYGTSDPALTYITEDASGTAVDLSAVMTGQLSRVSGEDVGSYEIEQGSLSAGPNYTITFTTGKKLTITAAGITITPEAKSKVYGTSDPALTYITEDASGTAVDLSTVMTGQLSRVIGEDVGSYEIEQGSLSAGPNYTITFTTGKKLTITAAGITITPEAKSKVYGTSDPALTYITEDASGTAVDLSTVMTGQLSRVIGEDVGSYEIEQGSLSAGPNYTITFTTGKKLTITAAGITITPEAKSKVYGTSDPALTYITEDASGTAVDLSSVMTGQLSRVIGEDVGSYEIEQGSLSAGPNYTITFTTGKKLTITATAITVTPEAKSKVYGTSDPALTYVTEDASGTAVDLSTVMTGQLSRVTGEDVGSYEIGQGSLSAGPNYTITFTTGKKLTITAAAITITPEAKSKVYGTSDPALTYITEDASGTAVDLSAVMTGQLSRVIGEDVGSYEIEQGSLSAGPNYTITFTTGKKLTITAAGITITPEAKSKVYGTSDPALTYITEDASGTAVDLSTVMTGQLSRVIGEDVGSYEIEQGSLSAGPNYTITFTTGKKLTITKATLTGVTFESKEFVYDGTVKRLELKGNIPGGAEVKYTNNDQVNAGTYKVTAEIVATTNYEGATYDATMVIHKAKQTIIFKAPTEVALEEEAVPLDVYATSGLPVTLLVNDPLIASVTGTVLKPMAEGTVQITATQPGDDNYEAATPVTVSVKIVKKNIPLNVRPHKAVSPNYDGINEFFKIDGIEYYPDNKVTIFDKNGVVMAEIVGYNNQDKRYTGELHRDGTYYYYLDVKENGVWRREKGYFVVRR